MCVCVYICIIYIIISFMHLYCFTICLSLTWKPTQLDVCNLWCGSCFNGLLYAVNLSSSAGPQWMQRAHLCWNEGLSELSAECKCGVLCIGRSQSRSRLPDLCREKNESGSLFIVSTQSGAYKDQRTDPNIKTLINLWLCAFGHVVHCCVKLWI